MTRLLFLIALALPHLCQAAPADELANRTLRCGKNELVFSADAWTVRLNGRSMRAPWGNGRRDVVLGNVDLIAEDDRWSFGDDNCVLK